MLMLAHGHDNINFYVVMCGISSLNMFKGRKNMSNCPLQMGGIDEAALDRLSLVTEMTKHIRVRANGGRSTASELGQFSPIFIWLLRVIRFLFFFLRISLINYQKSYPSS